MSDHFKNVCYQLFGIPHTTPLNVGSTRTDHLTVHLSPVIDPVTSVDSSLVSISASTTSSVTTDTLLHSPVLVKLEIFCHAPNVKF